MSGELQHEVTRILHDWSGGDQNAPGRLMPLVYDEMRRLARSKVSAGASQPPHLPRPRIRHHSLDISRARLIVE